MQTIKTVDRHFYKQLGNQLRKIREFRHMTLEELSKKTGYSRSLIDHWELGFNKIKDNQLNKLCEALKVNNMLSVSVNIDFDFGN